MIVVRLLPSEDNTEAVDSSSGLKNRARSNEGIDRIELYEWYDPVTRKTAGAILKCHHNFLCNELDIKIKNKFQKLI